ncbi:MAG: hypothetical protein ACXWC4_23050 [Telluria sp.]
MKRWLVLATLVLGGCSAWHGKTEPADAPVAKAKPAEPQLEADGVPIERVPFRPGVSSVTVEKMARGQQCSGGQGAGLVTENGPVEVYRMQCDNGKVFMARCELRQCRQM